MSSPSEGIENGVIAEENKLAHQEDDYFCSKQEIENQCHHRKDDAVFCIFVRCFHIDGIVERE